MKYYTIWLSVVCTAMFILQNIIPNFTNALLLTNQAFPEVWRFVTSIFLHASVLHIALNLFALLLFGLILEKIIGSNKFLLVFFASGIIANLIAFNFYPASLGASGAIYGIIGCLAVIRPKMTVWVYYLPMPMFIAAIVWVGVSVFGILNPSTTGDIAHISGIVIGFIFGFFYLNKFKEKKQRKDIIIIQENYMRSWEDRNLK